MSERAGETWRVNGDQRAATRELGGNSPVDTLRGFVDTAPELSGAVPMDPQELVDWLCTDQVKRWRAGQRVPAESYLARYPSVEESAESAVELIYGEFLLREEIGESPQLDEFQWRFPRFAARLTKQFDLHDALMATGSGSRQSARRSGGRRRSGGPNISGHGSIDCTRLQDHG